MTCRRARAAPRRLPAQPVSDLEALPYSPVAVAGSKGAPFSRALVAEAIGGRSRSERSPGFVVAVTPGFLRIPGGLVGEGRQRLLMTRLRTHLDRQVRRLKLSPSDHRASL